MDPGVFRSREPVWQFALPRLRVFGAAYRRSVLRAPSDEMLRQKAGTASLLRIRSTRLSGRARHRRLLESCPPARAVFGRARFTTQQPRLPAPFAGAMP